jgi:hypothetical protein
MIYLRRVARDLYYRKRHNAITGNEQTEAKKMKKLVFVIMAKLAGEVQGSYEFIHLDRCLRFCMAKYLFMTAGPDVELEHQPNLHRTIDSFNDDSSLLHFRFKKREDLRRMLHLLQFPDDIKMDNRSWQRGEEVFLRGLYEMRCGGNQGLAAIQVFGGVASDQSRAVGWFIHHIYDNFHHLVHNSLEWWYENGFLHESAAAIGRKMGLETNICMFIDCNCLTTSTPGGGPAEGGPEAIRW